jgi:poly-gamma-glutamate synthesis protein (capsule biosynthesis protein)
MYLPQEVPIPFRAWQLSERAWLHSLSWARAPDVINVSAGDIAVRLLAIGDLSLTRPGLFDGRTVFGSLVSLLDAADLRTGNFEAPLSSRPTPAGTIGSFLRANPRAGDLLAQLRIDVVNVANNHSLDFGLEGFAETLDGLESAGIDACGVASGDGGSRLTVKVVNGLRVGFLGFCDDHYCAPAPSDGPRPAMSSEGAVFTAIDAARSRVDVLTVHLHWGYEFTLHPLRRHRDMARRMVEHGADLVLCHHAHVPMAIEVWRGRVIAYGLGNGIVPMSGYMRGGHPWTDRSCLLEVALARDGIRSIRLHSFVIRADGTIGPLTGVPRRRLLAGLARMTCRLDDEAFLMRLDRCRFLFEAVRVIEALKDGAAKPDSTLQERALTLTVLRQQQLIGELTAIHGGAAAELRALAAAAFDARAVRAAYQRGRRVLDAAVPALRGQYRWQDALRARLP